MRVGHLVSTKPYDDTHTLYVDDPAIRCEPLDDHLREVGIEQIVSFTKEQG